MTPKADVLLAALDREEPELAAVVRLGGGPDSGLALLFRVEQSDGVAVLELVRPRRLDLELVRWVPISPGDLLAWVPAAPAIAHLIAARDDTTDDHVARTTAVDVARDLRLPLAELGSGGPWWHISPARLGR